MPNRHALNTTAINETTAVPAIPSFVDTQDTPFRLESRQQDGTLLNFLPDWWDASWHEEVNIPPTLTFSYDGTDTKSDDFVFPNEIWIYRADNTTVQEKFTITNIEEVEDEGYFKRVTCRGLLYQWSHEVITFSEQVGATIAATLGTWMALQTQTPTIHAFGIDAAIRSAIRNTRVENKTILEALNDLQRTIGGFFFVNASRTLEWHRTIGQGVGHIISLKKNATFIKKTSDYSALATRIIAYGRGIDKDIRLSVTVNDATAQSSFGIVAAVLNNQSISNISDLTDAANAELQRRKTPLVKYDVGVIDLSQTDVLDYTFEATALELGTQINIIGNESGIDINTRVLSVTRSLDNPIDVKITVGNPLAGTAAWGDVGDPPSPLSEQRLSDVITDLHRRASVQENDTGVFDDLLAQVAGGTLETPASGPLGPLPDPTCLSSWCPSTDVGNLTTHIVDIIENNTNTTTQISVTEAIVVAATEVMSAAGGAGYDSTVYNNYVTETETIINEGDSGIKWDDELAAHPTLPTAKPTVYYNTVDDQLWIGYNGSGTSDEWTPMQKTTSLSGGTPT